MAPHLLSPALLHGVLPSVDQQTSVKSIHDDPLASNTDSGRSLGVRLETLLAKHAQSQEMHAELMQEQMALLFEARTIVREHAEGERHKVVEGDVDVKTAASSPRKFGTFSHMGTDPDHDGMQYFYSDASQSTTPHVELRDYNTNLTTFTGQSEAKSANCNCPRPQDGIIACVTGICSCILGWRHFELMMGIIITMNAFNIGWTIDRELRDQSVAVQDFMETCFLIIFILEIAMRIIVKGWRCLKVPANLFDFLLVLITSITTVVAPVVEMSSGGEDNFLQQVMILRMMRLLRLARAVRLVATFRPLWKLAKGLTDCCTTMFSALLLMMICIYIFACFGAEFISKVHLKDSDPDVRHQIEMHFSSLPKILLTLMRFTTMDSTHSFYAPLVYKSPGLAIYFLLLLVIVAIALMNLITALLVEDAINSAKMDQEMRIVYCREKIKTLKPALRALFQTLDKSGDGVVEVEEVVKSIREGNPIPVELHEIVNPARMLDLFEALDVDHSGDLSENEFVEGLCCVATSDMPRETMQVLQLLRSLRHEIRKCLKQNARLSSNLAYDRRTSSHISLTCPHAFSERQTFEGNGLSLKIPKHKDELETVEAAQTVLTGKMTFEEKAALSKEMLAHDDWIARGPGFEI